MKRFNNILCVVEPEIFSAAAITKAALLAKNHQAQLTVISVVQKPDSFTHFVSSQKELDELLADCVSQKAAALKVFVAQYCAGLKVAVDVLVGVQFIEVIKNVLEYERDLVVKSPNQERWFDRLFGSNDMHLLRKCPCPVLMMKSEMSGGFQRILATVDVAEQPIGAESEDCVQEQLNRQVLDLASSFALAESAQLHIGCAWDAYGEDFLRYGAFSNMTNEKLNQYVAQLHNEVSDKLGRCIREMNSYVGDDAVKYIQPHVHLVKGLPAQEIPVMVKDKSIDLVVMGTVARTGIPGFIIGNTAEAILDQVDCSVLAIKPLGFLSPVTL